LSSTEQTRSAIRKFGIVFAVILSLVALISMWRGRETLVLPFFTVSAAVMLSSLVFPRLLSPLYYLMLRVSGYMGWFNTRLILVIVYYLVFTPTALLFKLLGKDPLSRHFERDAPSYWMRRSDDGRDTKSHYEKQF
jgi:hypothetical protein